jgi:hypothetical protein
MRRGIICTRSDQGLTHWYPPIGAARLGFVLSRIDVGQRLFASRMTKLPGILSARQGGGKRRGPSAVVATYHPLARVIVGLLITAR